MRLASCGTRSTRFVLDWLFEPRDLWLGIFWDFADVEPVPSRDGRMTVFCDWQLSIYVCIVPVFPLRLRVIRDEE